MRALPARAHAADRADRAPRARRPGPSDPVPPGAPGPRQSPVHAVQVPHHARALRRRRRGRCRTSSGPRFSGAFCAAPGSTSCRSSSTCCAATCRSSARGRSCRAICRTESASASRSGPASPAGPRSTAATGSSAEEKVALDAWYVRNAGPLLDLRIIGRTLKMMLLGGGARAARARAGAGRRARTPASPGREPLLPSRHQRHQPAADRPP